MISSEEFVAKLLKEYGFEAFPEPLTGVEPDVIAFDIRTKTLIIIEVKWGQRVDNSAISQVCKYRDKLKEFFNKMGFNVMIWIIASQVSPEKNKELERCNVKFINIDNIFYELNKIIGNKLGNK